MEARLLALKPLANITMPSPSAPPPPPAPPRMPSGQRLDSHIAAGISVGMVVLLCFLTCFICRVWRRNRYYSKVQRTLDDEERAFQECAHAAARPKPQHQPRPNGVHQPSPNVRNHALTLTRT